jgi:GDP-L-fucose synthase
MKILVTGGNGFLGKHLLPKLTASEHEVFAPNSKVLNLLDRTSCYNVIGKYEPDVILHMAALCGGILANKNSPAEFLHQNVDMTSNIFLISKVMGIRKIYTLGSVCAYPKYCPAPFKEDDLWNGYPEETNAPYGMAKRLQLLMGQTYRQQYGIGGAHLIPVNLYGEHDHFDPINSHVIPALIRKFIAAERMEHPVVECWGTGEATREFLYAGDAADAISKAVLTGFDSPLPINLGTGKDISIKDLVEWIADIVNFQGEIVFTGEVSDGQPKRMLDVSRAKELLGWTANTMFDTGLRRTIDWYRNQNATAELDALGG